MGHIKKILPVLATITTFLTTSIISMEQEEYKQFSKIILERFKTQEDRNKAGRHIVKSLVSDKKNRSLKLEGTTVEFCGDNQLATIMHGDYNYKVPYDDLRKIFKEDCEENNDCYYYVSEFTIHESVYDDNGKFIRPSTVRTSRRKER